MARASRTGSSRIRRSGSTSLSVRGFNFGIMAAYDYQFRNAGWDEGILWAGLDLGIRF